MKQFSTFLLSLIAIFESSGGGLVVAAEADEDRRFIVGFVEGSVMYQERLNQYLEERRTRKLQASADEVVDVEFLVPENAQVMILKTDKEVQELQDNDEVAYVEPDLKVHIPEVPDTIISPPDDSSHLDASEQRPYGLDMIKLGSISDANEVGNQKICIVDSGYDLNHVDLPSPANSSPGTISGSADGGAGPWDEDGHGHGTHVAGTIVALGNNSKGVVGVIGNGKANLHIVRVFRSGDALWAWTSGLINAIEECENVGANIVNMSLGRGGGTLTTEIIAYNRMYNEKNMLLIAAAGNAGNSNKSYPASYDAVMSVAAVDSNEIRASYSQYNAEVEIAAPGTNVLSTIPNNSYATASGTSMATPHVSGVAALVWSQFPDKSAQEIREALTATAKDIGTVGRDHFYGYGLIQAEDAYQYLAERAPSTSPSSSPSQDPSSQPSNAPSNTPSSTPTSNDPGDNTGNGGGDPHFKGFNGVYFSYHGECDMILMRSKMFGNGLGLAVHIRTTRVEIHSAAYSYISSMAMQIGRDTLEVSGEDGELIVNGEVCEAGDGKATPSLGEYAIKTSSKGAQNRIIIHDVILGEEEKDEKIITIRSNTKSGLVFVDVKGRFDDSEGLLGARIDNQGKGGFLSRDGSMDMTGQWNSYGEEWQVQQGEAMLFREARAPQHPVGCLYYDSSAVSSSVANKKSRLRRRLLDEDGSSAAAAAVSLEAATGACDGSIGEKKQFCIDDVMAIGDLELAEDPFYSA